MLFRSRKIGLDVGDKTIGIAVSDPLCITAQGVTTLERIGIRKDAGKVMDMIREYDCDGVVIGLPLSMSDKTSAMPNSAPASSSMPRTKANQPD